MNGIFSDVCLMLPSMIDKTSDKSFRSFQPVSRQPGTLKRQCLNDQNAFQLWWDVNTYIILLSPATFKSRSSWTTTWWFPVISSTESQYIVARKLVNIKMDKKRFRFPTCQFGALARAIFLWCIRIMVKFAHIPVGRHGGTLAVSYLYIDIYTFIYHIICFVV